MIEDGCKADWNEERVDMIGRNGDNCGAWHYGYIPRMDDGPSIAKQERYLGDDGDDLIDKWAKDKTHDEFRTIMWAMIEKYQCRLGKKAPIPEETAKMLDYMGRWNSYEMEWADD